MSQEDDTYSTMFTTLKHPIRRKILNILNQTPTTYTDIQTQLGIDNGLLNYHLDNMRDLITKNEEELYTLSEFGKATLNLVRGVEEPASSLPDKSGVSMKLLNRLLVACFIIVAVVSAAVIIDLNWRYTRRLSICQSLGMWLRCIRRFWGHIDSVNSIALSSLPFDTHPCQCVG